MTGGSHTLSNRNIHPIITVAIGRRRNPFKAADIAAEINARSKKYCATPYRISQLLSQRDDVEHAGRDLWIRVSKRRKR